VRQFSNQNITEKIAAYVHVYNYMPAGQLHRTPATTVKV